MRIESGDMRFEHIRKVLKMSAGDEIFAGEENGKLFICRLIETNDAFELEPLREVEQKCPRNLTLAVAYARPVIARRILFESACMGVKNLIFYPATKGESSYSLSSLYAGNEWKSCLIRGAQQACATSIPDFHTVSSLAEALKLADQIEPASKKLAADPYEATCDIWDIDAPESGISLFMGSERGFAELERHALRAAGCELVRLSSRILRTDTAVICALAHCLRS